MLLQPLQYADVRKPKRAAALQDKPNSLSSVHNGLLRVRTRNSKQSKAETNEGCYSSYAKREVYTVAMRVHS